MIIFYTPKHFLVLSIKLTYISVYVQKTQSQIHNGCKFFSDIIIFAMVCEQPFKDILISVAFFLLRYQAVQDILGLGNVPCYIFFTFSYMSVHIQYHASMCREIKNL